MVGRTISHYRIHQQIGAGGMGVVYKAEDTRLHRFVALKFLPSDSVSKTQQKRFLQEARAAAKLQHPNICPIHDIGDEDGQLFYAMALISGTPLSTLVTGGTLPVALALDIAIQVANGLESAHRSAVVHRDIKSSNIVVSDTGHAVILDFGLALIGSEPRLTSHGSTVGTISYMSPEQATGAEVDHRTDIWSLGIVLFEMLAGELPFRKGHHGAMIHRIIHEEPAQLRALRPETPEELEIAILRALEKNPEQRWETAASFAAELWRIRGTLPSAASAIPVPAVIASWNPTSGPPYRAEENELQSTQTNLAISPEPRRRRLFPVTRRAALATIGLALTAVLSLLAYSLGWLPFEGVTLPEEKRVAMLPLALFPEEQTLRAFSDGLVDAVTAELGQLERFQGKLMVVPASEIRSRKIDSAEEARRRYGANLAITGSAQRYDDEIRVTLNLVDADSLRQVATRAFPLKLDDPRAVRTAVEESTRLLSLQFNSSQVASIAAGAPEEGGAQLKYLEGRGYLARYDVQGNIDRAIDSFMRAIDQEPGYALAYAGLARAYWRKAVDTEALQWADLAVENAKRAVETEGNLAVTRVTLGAILSYRGRHEEAIEQFRLGLRLVPGDSEALVGLGDVYAAQGRYDEAETQYLEATRRRPQDWFSHLVLGVFYIYRSRWNDAQGALNTALRLAPDNAIIYRNLAVVDMYLGHYSDARRNLETALKLEQSAVLYSSLGVALFYEARFAEAASALETAIDLQPGDYVAWGNLGTAYRWVPGAKPKAEAAFRKAIELGQSNLQLNPKDHRVRANLAEYRAKIGDMNGALREVANIPEAVRSSYAVRIAMAYELAGKRAEAIRVIAGLPKEFAVLNEIKHDPDLAGLWKDSKFQQEIVQSSRAPD